MRVLLKFSHGLGDAVQLTVVLKHLAKYCHDWEVDVYSLSGKHTAIRGLCANSFSDADTLLDEASYDKVFELDWWECDQSFDTVPSTKAALCLKDVFNIDPDPALFFYSVTPELEDIHGAANYLTEITGVSAVNGRWPVALVHYEGNTATASKNLSHAEARAICEKLIASGLVPVVLDWDNRSPLPDNVNIFCPGANHKLWRGLSTGDAGIIAALIAQSTLMVGIDSGPLHVAAATSTPTVAVWVKHHPAQYFDLADNVLHFVPENFAALARHEQTNSFFISNYRHQVYRELAVDFPEAVTAILGDRGVDAPAVSGSGLARKIEHQRYYSYIRVGYDFRPLELLPGGRIVSGKDDASETSWAVIGTASAPQLGIFYDDELLVVLSLGGQDMFYGQWVKFEKMPCLLLPVPVNEHVLFAAQNGEDKWMAENCDLPHHGVFVEVGVATGIRHSNTYWLERRGWRGLLVEADERNLESIRLVRNTPLEHCAASDRDGVTPFIQHFDVTLSGINRSVHDGTEVLVPARRLDTLLAAHNLPTPDVMSIDTEGSEFSVLDGLGTVRPKYLIVEYLTLELTVFNKKIPLTEKLIAMGYSVINSSINNLIARYNG